MKNFLICLAIIFVSTSASAQFKTEVEGFGVKTSIRVDIQNSKVADFLKSTDFRKKNVDVDINEGQIYLETLKNGSTGIKFILSKGTYQTIYAIQPSLRTEFLYYFLQGNATSTKTFNANRTLLYTANNMNNMVQIQMVAAGKSAFSNCMDAVEDDFESEPVGWIYWNLNPPVQVLAATMCGSCVSWGVLCPAAYAATLEEK